MEACRGLKSPSSSATAAACPAAVAAAAAAAARRRAAPQPHQTVPEQMRKLSRRRREAPHPARRQRGSSSSSSRASCWPRRACWTTRSPMSAQAQEWCDVSPAAALIEFGQIRCCVTLTAHFDNCVEHRPWGIAMTVKGNAQTIQVLRLPPVGNWPLVDLRSCCIGFSHPQGLTKANLQLRRCCGCRRWTRGRRWSCAARAAAWWTRECSPAAAPGPAATPRSAASAR